MRSFKSEFNAGKEKPIITVHCFVPSWKRKEAMTKDEKTKAKAWAKNTIDTVRVMLKDLTK